MSFLFDQLDSSGNVAETFMEALTKAAPSIKELPPQPQKVAELSGQLVEEMIERYQALEEASKVGGLKAGGGSSWSIAEEARCVAWIHIARDQLNHQRQERLHQARTIFTITLIALVVGIVLVFAGVIGIYVVNLTVGTITAASGIIVDILSTVVLSLNRETNNRLDTIAEELSVLDRTAMAMHYIGYISDTRKRDQAMTDLIRYLYALPTDRVKVKKA